MKDTDAVISFKISCSLDSTTWPAKDTYEAFTDLITEENVKGEEEDGHAHYHPPHRISQTLQESRRLLSVMPCVPFPTILTRKLQQNSEPIGQAAEV